MPHIIESRVNLVHRAITATLEQMALDSKIAADNERKLMRGLRIKGDSQCLICGRIHYNQRLEKCSKCGGRCHFYAPGAMNAMERLTNESDW